MHAMRIPKDVAAAIDECWPDGVIEEFDRLDQAVLDLPAPDHKTEKCANLSD